MKLLIIFLLTNLSFNAAFGQYRNHANINKSGIAIDGFDPVSYQIEGKAKEGNKKFSYLHDGINYYFSSQQNLDRFKNNPSQFIPAYGGWCAFAMGDYGEKVKIDPYTFKVIEGKTYLFYNFYFNNTLDSWNKNESGLKKSADSNWIKIIKTK